MFTLKTSASAGSRIDADSVAGQRCSFVGVDEGVSFVSRHENDRNAETVFQVFLKAARLEGSNIESGQEIDDEANLAACVDGDLVGEGAEKVQAGYSMRLGHCMNGGLYFVDCELHRTAAAALELKSWLIFFDLPHFIISAFIELCKWYARQHLEAVIDENCVLF
jgi:hypothetical protein